MRSAIPIIFVIAAALSASVVFTQSREITEAQLKQRVDDAVAKRKGILQRQKTTTTGYSPEDFSESVLEYGPNDTYHYRTVKTSKGVETKTEGIRIGEERYTRKPDGTWIKEPPPPKFVGTGAGSGSGSGYGNAVTKAPEENTELRLVGKEKIGGQPTSHYRKTHTIRFTSRTPIVVRKVIDDYWFSADGMLLKESHEDVFENSKSQYKSVTEYEYNVKIDIRAPISD
jgi:hypothetical protein